MEKERRIKVLSMVALIVAVLGLTVAFASLSQTLTINGTATVNAASWDVHFENLTDPEINGDASVSGETTLSGTTISGLNLIVTKPNDYITYYFDIVNAGTIDAKISSISLTINGETRNIKYSEAVGAHHVEMCSLTSPVESCDWNNDGEVTQDDVDKANNNIVFVFTKTVGDSGEFIVDEVLNANSKIETQLGLAYNNFSTEDLESTELPKRDLQFNNISLTINYKQA